MFSSLLGFVVVHKQYNINLIKARARSVGSSFILFNIARQAGSRGVTSALGQRENYEHH